MNNFSKITLRNKRDKLAKQKGVVQRSLNMLKWQGTDYAEHHQHVINAYGEILDVLDTYIADSEDIGKGI